MKRYFASLLQPDSESFHGTQVHIDFSYIDGEGVVQSGTMPKVMWDKLPDVPETPQVIALRQTLAASI